MKRIRKTLGAEVNYQHFNLVVDPDNPFEDYGWSEDDIRDMLYIEEFELDEWQDDAELFNDLGILYNDAVGVERDMEKAIRYYERAVELDDDLARSNLADIYRKGIGGVEKNPIRAFELYKACKLPYAYYRVGEAYEHGWGVEKNEDAAKFNYLVAYKAGHPLARKKLKTFNFLTSNMVMDKYNLATLRTYLPETEGKYGFNNKDCVWDAKRIVREYIKLAYLIKRDKSFEDIAYSNQIRLQRLVSAIKALTNTEENGTLYIIRSVFDSDVNDRFLSKSIITFSAYKQIRKLLHEIMPDDNHVEFALRSHDAKEGRSMLIDRLLRQRMLSYNLATSNSGVLCCSSEESVGIYAFENLYNPFIAYCDNIIDDLIVLLLGKSLDGQYTTEELQEHFGYPKVTDGELLDWEIDNW